MLSLLNLDTLSRLWQGLFITLEISIISIIITSFFGLILGILMSFKNRYIYILCRFILEFVRIMPLLVWLFIVYFGFSRWLGVNLSSTVSAIIVFSIWGSFEMMDLVRSSLQSIPKHQYESAKSLGLNKFQAYFYIIIPQAFRRLTPVSMNLLTRMIKSTTFAYLIGSVELVKVGQQIIEFNNKNDLAPFIIYGFIFFIFFIICYPITLYSRKLEKKWS
ncbi:amino acid ABC transporter permease [Campylobacter sp. LH-2024]|uniref:amino acid ABC transporter permease n=1 Tax=Campylobacter TaxID=194 RepID=UPI001D2E7460|nr:amino acid ABC transporter permease [Campylobacter sp. RM10537]MBZ7929407.1 amino acid ABC transporter permease [Campylobacter sp. W0067]MBZ7932870.1 amino acid ABC transporter permease [Campylobacter sp. RM10543]MBZ7937208.1 amino acid ABC transporter permease [Campylobacter sp. RM10538]MBZ7940642.1 amino acid ABC transporter permease [Campylobacter sp. W0047]MBZ7943512.1 amino acid ABC transporter permease [Campylobacter sp. RM13744]MBZ7945925.1 amino acid ABC transporter permease [Campy